MQKIEVLLVDDIGGEPASQCVRFGLDGQQYEIDLTDARAEALRASLEKFMGSARKLSGKRPASGQRPASTGSAASAGKRSGVNNTVVTTEAERRLIRSWAATEGIALNERGRIPASIIARYRETQRA